MSGLRQILPMSQIFGAVSFRSASADLRLWLDKPNSRCRPAREGGKSGSRSESGAAPATVVENVTAQRPLGASGKVPDMVRKDPALKPETSL